MKMCKRIAALAMVFFLIVATSCTLNAKSKYPSGKDTIETYGDGTFQLVKISPASGVFYKALSFEKYHSVVIAHVDNEKKVDGKVYFLGHEDDQHVTDQGVVDVRYTIYAVLELKSNTMQYCAVSDNPFAEAIYISRRDEMVKNKDMVFFDSLSDFSDEDANVLRSISTTGDG